MYVCYFCICLQEIGEKIWLNDTLKVRLQISIAPKLLIFTASEKVILLPGESKWTLFAM